MAWKGPAPSRPFRGVTPDRELQFWRRVILTVRKHKLPWISDHCGSHLVFSKKPISSQCNMMVGGRGSVFPWWGAVCRPGVETALLMGGGSLHGLREARGLPHLPGCRGWFLLCHPCLQEGCQHGAGAGSSRGWMFSGGGTPQKEVCSCP